jgi:DNA helicase-2/ATP-dependent DNA helicase PcrA
MSSAEKIEGDRQEALTQALNPPQLEACRHPGGPLLIVAGPGSGKTRVITNRIAWLVRERGLRPEEILAITFTNKAAREMRERVEVLLGSLGGAWIGTFHATCARILRRDIEVLGRWTRDFTIYDTSDRNLLLKRITKDLGLDPAHYRPASLGSRISAFKNGLRDFEDGDPESFEGEIFHRVHRRYEADLLAANALDFDDLLLRVLEIFDEHPGVRDAWARRFRHVLVDEYQDTNRIQYLLVRHLANPHHQVTVCGDPDQSIYAWRGADIRNILDFEADFGQATVVKLEQNYRSKGTILAAASALIANNSRRHENSLWTEAENGEKLVVIQCATEDDEGSEIARQILGLRARNVRFRDCAVFYRANFMQRAIESALRLASIPYQVVAGVEFYARAEIRDLISYLRLIVNPADDVAFRRVVNSPSRGVGETSIEKLAGWAADRRVPLLQAVRSTEALGTIRGRARSGLVEFRELLDSLVDEGSTPAAVALGRLLASIDVERWLAELGGETDRSENVEELRSHASRYDKLVPDGGLRGFLQEVALVSDVDGLSDTEDRVVLMTLHSAKGLEFDHVFITGVEEELLPHARSLGEARGSDDGVEEERRLLYVGMTRARERLTMTHAIRRLHFGGERFASRSRFLDEIPPRLIEGTGHEQDEKSLLGEFQPPPRIEVIHVGDRVAHERFGEGRVEAVVGSGVNARATVRFTDHGTRQLLLVYANLARVGARHG